MFSPVPNGEVLVGNMESDCGSVEDSYTEDSKDGNNDSDGSDEIESSPSAGARTKRRSKQT